MRTLKISGIPFFLNRVIINQGLEADLIPLDQIKKSQNIFLTRIYFKSWTDMPVFYAGPRTGVVRGYELGDSCLSGCVTSGTAPVLCLC